MLTKKKRHELVTTLRLDNEEYRILDVDFMTLKVQSVRNPRRKILVSKTWLPKLLETITALDKRFPF
jgi:hypothetical protein